MAPDSCVKRLIGICFEPASVGSSAPVFGIADFLATVAIFVVAYSFSDARYKFRTASAAIPFRGVFFASTLFGGVGLLATNMWFSFKLPIPAVVNNPAIFQSIIAALLIAVLALWMYRSFVRPSRFSESNALPFAREVFRSITDGDDAELAAAAYEIGRSAGPIMRASTKTTLRRDFKRGGLKRYRHETAQIAAEILSLIGDRRFCRIVALRQPWVAAEIFHQAAEAKVDVRPLVQFSRNVSDEFFLNENSAIHHEGDGYYSGLIGYIKPVTSIIFGNSELVDRLAEYDGSPLDLMWLRHGLWKIGSWETYNKAVILYLSDRLEKEGRVYASHGLREICYGLEHVGNDVYKVNEMSDGEYYSSLAFQKFRAATELVREIVSLLDEKNVLSERQPRFENGHPSSDDLYNQLAKVGLNLIAAAGAVNTPDFRSWSVQHNTLWTTLMRNHEDAGAWRIFRARLQRLIWSEVSKMETMPNYVGAHILSVCLNTMAFRMDHPVRKPAVTRALKRLVLRWVKRNYLKLHGEYPDVARACVGGTVTFDSKANRLVKTYSGFLGKEPAREFLDLDPVC